MPSSTYRRLAPNPRFRYMRTATAWVWSTLRESQRAPALPRQENGVVQERPAETPLSPGWMDGNRGQGGHRLRRQQHRGADDHLPGADDPRVRQPGSWRTSHHARAGHDALPEAQAIQPHQLREVGGERRRSPAPGQSAPTGVIKPSQVDSYVSADLTPPACNRILPAALSRVVGRNHPNTLCDIDLRCLLRDWHRPRSGSVVGGDAWDTAPSDPGP